MHHVVRQAESAPDSVTAYQGHRLPCPALTVKMQTQVTAALRRPCEELAAGLPTHGRLSTDETAAKEKTARPGCGRSWLGHSRCWPCLPRARRRCWPISSAKRSAASSPAIGPGCSGKQSLGSRAVVPNVETSRHCENRHRENKRRAQEPPWSPLVGIIVVGSRL